MDELELLVFKEFVKGKIQTDKLELDKRGFYKIGRFQMKQLQIIGKKILSELDKDNNIISDLQNEVTLKQCELDKKDKRLKRQFKIITKRDKQIEEIKQIAHNDFEERCKLTFKIEELENELEKKDKIINLMAEQLTTPVHSKKWVIDYFTNKVEEDK